MYSTQGIVKSVIYCMTVALRMLKLYEAEKENYKISLTAVRGMPYTHGPVCLSHFKLFQIGTTKTASTTHSIINYFIIYLVLFYC